MSFTHLIQKLKYEHILSKNHDNNMILIIEFRISAETSQTIQYNICFCDKCLSFKTLLYLKKKIGKRKKINHENFLFLKEID